VGEDQFVVDTDILIAYLNGRAYRRYLESPENKIYYSAVTKKELLSKQGLKATERKAILTLLRRFRLVRIDQRIAKEYGRLRSTYSSLERGDALIAATALATKLPLLTQNLRHFRVIKELVLLPLPH
jgi:predicted nucleic acid-binding protein